VNALTLYLLNEILKSLQLGKWQLLIDMNDYIGKISTHAEFAFLVTSIVLRIRKQSNPGCTSRLLCSQAAVQIIEKSR
jgi:hypothetical protein